jgi:hypothetical protein
MEKGGRTGEDANDHPSEDTRSEALPKVDEVWWWE